jgi:tRNA pseudouridine55 synthase
VNAPSGLLVVDKPGGLTSHDVVGRVRRLAGTRKVGHAGTLDPMATGVLVLGINRATRLLGHLTLTDKAYDATVRLGQSTVTDDAEGDVVSSVDASGLEDAAVTAALAAMTGEVDQVPSAVSAVKVGGERAYKKVRAGETPELAARRVTVHELTVHDLRRVGTSLDVDVTVRCSSGTYVRAVARDLGSALGVGGHLTRLRRTAVGGVGLAEATPLEDLVAGELPLMTLEDAVARFFPVRRLDDDQSRDVSFGRALAVDLGVGGAVALLAPDGTFLALYEQREPGLAKAVAVFV